MLLLKYYLEVFIKLPKNGKMQMQEDAPKSNFYNSHIYKLNNGTVCSIFNILVQNFACGLKSKSSNKIRQVI